MRLDDVMTALAARRPIFHSEADFQHALAWQIQTAHPDATVRLETRPERGLRLDVLIRLRAETVAIELKYLVARFAGTVGGEHFDLPNQAAHDISRHDFIKDVARVERFVRDGVADRGWAIALSNDQGYWQPGRKPDPVDAKFRIHEGRELAGVLTWGALAGHGTTKKRDEPLHLTGSYRCAWREYASVQRADGRAVSLRYLAVEVLGAAALVERDA